MPQRGSIDPNQIQPLSKGSLITSIAITGVDHSGFNFENGWLPPGPDGYFLSPDSTAPEGLSYVPPTGAATGDDVGAANAYAVTLSPVPVLIEYFIVVFKAANSNTGASTLALNGGTAIAIKKQGSIALGPGDIVAGQIIEVVYDGTNWQLISASGFTGTIAESQVTNLVTDLAAKAAVTGIQQEAYTYAADTGAANAYAVSLSPSPTIVAGSKVIFKAANANTGASTLAVNGGSPIAIKKQGSTALASGDIAAGQIVVAVYDGTNFQMIGAPGASASIPVVGTFDIGSGVTGTDVTPHGFAPRAGSFLVCKVSVKAADATVALTFTIKQNGVSIFSANPTLAGGTAPGVYSVGTLTTTPLSFAQDDLFTLDITSGSSSWQLTVQLR
jgi:hypothetical protein